LAKRPDQSGFAIATGRSSAYKEGMKEPRQVQRRPSTNAAFSLVELLVVVVIIVILTMLYWKQKGPSKRDIDLASCQQNLERIYLAMQIYAHDNKDAYPVVTNAQYSEEALAPLVPRYTSDTGIFFCPATASAPQPAGTLFRDWKISYAYYMGRHASDVDTVVMSDAQIDTQARGKGDTAFSETGKPPGNNHGKGGGNFMMCEGSVASSGPDAPFPLRFTKPVVLLNPKP
jgi:prepilin-type N-terminal cleavage/methylation domain-containing protein